jgi:FtsH ternary system-associated peptide
MRVVPGLRPGHPRDLEVTPVGTADSESEPSYVFVPHLPDLIEPEEYADHPDGRLVRIRITVTGEGVEILGDSFRPAAVEQIMAALGGGPIEQMLCG